MDNEDNLSMIGSPGGSVSRGGTTQQATEKGLRGYYYYYYVVVVVVVV